MRDIPGLTGLRGIAALWVCLFHYIQNDHHSWLLLKLSQYGSQGVIVFFILSGFILSYVYNEWFSEEVHSRAYLQFLGLRFARIYPLHIFTLCMLGLLMLWGIAAVGPNDSTYTFLLNVLLMHAWGFTERISWNLPSWSISIEAFQYLLLPFVIPLFARMGLSALCVATASLYLAYDNHLVEQLALALGANLDGIQFAYGLSLIWFFEVFTIGAGLYFVTKNVQSRLNVSFLFDGALLAGIVLLLYWSLTDSLVGHRTVIATILIIFGLYRDAGLGRIAFGNPVTVFLGKISYSLYLTHNWLIFLFTFFLIKFFPGLWFAMVPVPVSVGIAIIVASAIHYGVERPSRTALRHLVSRVLGRYSHSAFRRSSRPVRL